MNQAVSPFKFLDSYQQADAAVFFGREEETQDLYKALSGVKHLLVYGLSGSGKTSLVECGLRNQFSDADWFALTIRRGSNINSSVFASINKELDVKIKMNPLTKMPLDNQMEFGNAVEKLFAKRYQPIYLLFDQFEELLISGDEEEKKLFFTHLNKLINYKVPCRIMLIMREEFIGNLSEFEPLCPSIFQHRFRVEKMGRKNVEDVIYHILEAPKYRAYFTVQDSRKLAESILLKLPDKRKEIELAHVQVFLGELWDRAQKEKKENVLPVLSANLIGDNDNLETVLESFLKKQIESLEEDYGKGVPLELLAAMISERFTKLQLTEALIKNDLEHKKVVSKKPINQLLTELETSRIIRTIIVGDETQYEISHDVLALVVGQNLTDEMKMREKAGDIYKVYGERKGLFTQDDIDYLRPYEQSLSYPPELQTRIDESIAVIKKQREEELAKTRKRLRVVYSLLGLALLGLIAAGYFGYKAKESEKETNVALANSKKLINAFYFYDDKFALAFKDRRFYFIDKKGNEVIKLGKWEKAEQFDQNGFAKVREDDSRKDFVIDTLGNIYKAAFYIEEIDSATEYVDFSEYNFEEIPIVLFKCQNLHGLILSHKYLYSLPQEIGKLKNLTILDLNFNRIDSLPKEIGNLKKLKSLGLVENKMDYLPKEIGELENLTFLDLALNNFDSLPKEIWDLKNLTILDLEENRLTSLPKEIGELKNLTALILSDNQLDSLPKEIGELKNLTFLNLASNNLTTLPKEIGELKNLTSLNLSGLLTSLPKEIWKLKNLTILDLSYCDSLTTLPKEIGELENLTKLDLSFTSLKSLPKEIGQLKNLKGLDLSGTKISGTELYEIRKKLPNCMVSSSESE